MYGCIECLHREMQVSLNRIVQEALSNIARHANASQVWINLDCSKNNVLLTIEDNGHGFNPDESKPQNGSYGLMNIQERAIIFGGTSEIKSTPGKGTTIRVEIPLYTNTEGDNAG